jgi:hypothetical protein
MSATESNKQRASFEAQICRRQAGSYASEDSMRTILLRKDSDGNYMDERVQWAWESYVAAHNELAADMAKKRAALFRMQIAMGSASKRLSSSEDCSDVPAKLMAEAKHAAAAFDVYAPAEVEMAARTMYVQWLDLTKAASPTSYDLLTDQEQELWRTKAVILLSRVCKIADESS